MIFKSFRDAIDAEILDRHAEVRDGRLGVGAALGQADVLRAGADAEAGGYILAMLNRQSEQALVEFRSERLRSETVRVSG